MSRKHPRTVLQDRLALQKQKFLYRSLAEELDIAQVDFCSNDYLGLARSSNHNQSAVEPGGSTGSRLVSGNTFSLERVETKIAKLQGFESGLAFASGFVANLGLLSAVALRGDTVILDDLAHASLIDGAQLSLARRAHFKHNDLVDLEKKLQKAAGQIFVVVESVYSMDGDCAPLVELVSLCEKYSAALIVDEAHGFGVIGEDGEGLVAQLGLQDAVFACVYTFGKAAGYHGALVCGEDWLKEYLVNFCRAFVYTTAPPVAFAHQLESAYEQTRAAVSSRSRLQENIAVFSALCRQSTRWNFLASDTAIQGVLVPGNAQVRKVEEVLRSAGFAVKAIVSPTVPIGTERIRICLHSYNTPEEIVSLLEMIESAGSRSC